MVKYRALTTLPQIHNTLHHSIESLASTPSPQTTLKEVAVTKLADGKWEALSPHMQGTEISQAGVYLNEFIGVMRGGPAEI